MYIPDEMKKENMFQDVAIPTNKSFFARLGAVSPEKLEYSGDNVVPEPMSKSESYDDFVKWAEMKQAELEKEDSK